MVNVELKNRRKSRLTSSQSFPWDKRGYSGAFGFAKLIVFDMATRFGCKYDTTKHKCRIDKAPQFVDKAGHTFCSPPENKAKEKSDLWLIN